MAEMNECTMPSPALQLRMECNSNPDEDVESCNRASPYSRETEKPEDLERDEENNVQTW